ncbi:MAG: geranylgeranylglyceryl/heptaprenylglyceryl phosphate synthase [Chitinispirillales bacterium]|jgi:phosphoglycerol geranylgeranyltransferase|nr:geranylgeranylglyceryl/heptaprenylglyceryl phosphate synthase [Chitinispirillales bacterium]
MGNDVYKTILQKFLNKKKQYWILLDPDDFSQNSAADLVEIAQNCGVDAVLVGGSLIHTDSLEIFVAKIKEKSLIPIILFPGDSSQIAKNADAILFMSLISGRNPDFLIGQQVKGAVQIARNKIEPIPMGYMLIESGTVTSVEFMSNTHPIPREKSNIAAAHALAAQFLGMKMLYLEAGSGAKIPVPNEMISAVKKSVSIPLIVGGGINDSETAKQKFSFGADILVTGNMLSKKNGIKIMKEIAETAKNYE